MRNSTFTGIQPNSSEVSSWELSILGFLILLNVLEKSHDKKTFSVQTVNSAMEKAYNSGKHLLLV
jgi:hypothetical protein